MRAGARVPWRWLPRLVAVAAIPLAVTGTVVLAGPRAAPPEDARPRPVGTVQTVEPARPAGDAEPEMPPTPPPPAAVPSTPAREQTRPPGPSAEPAEPAGRGPYEVTLVRAAGRLDPGLLQAVAAVPGVVASSAVHAGQVRLLATTGADGEPVAANPDGWAAPFDVAGIDPATFPAFLPESARTPFAALRPGEALLSETSGTVQGLAPGAVLHTDDADLEIVGVVADTLIGTAEAVVDPATAERLGLRVQFLLAGAVPADAAAAARVAELAAAAPGTLADALGRAPWPESWREVLPTAIVKERFGEFVYRPAGGRGVVQDPDWVDAHLVTASVPLLGEVRCHRVVVAPLADALAELEADGLAHLVDPGDYAGCHSPRLMSPGGPVSRHAWGLAVDLNASANPFGAAPSQDPRLVEVLDRHGFGYGGRWPTPDGMHFEYRGP